MLSKYLPFNEIRFIPKTLLFCYYKKFLYYVSVNSFLVIKTCESNSKTRFCK